MKQRLVVVRNLRRSVGPAIVFLLLILEEPGQEKSRGMNIATMFPNACSFSCFPAVMSPPGDPDILVLQRSKTGVADRLPRLFCV